MEFESNIPAEHPRTLTSVEAAALFGVTNDYVSQLCRRGKIRGTFTGRTWIVEEGSLRAYLAESRSRRLVQREYLSRHLRENIKPAAVTLQAPIQPEVPEPAFLAVPASRPSPMASAASAKRPARLRVGVLAAGAVLLLASAAGGYSTLVLQAAQTQSASVSSALGDTLGQLWGWLLGNHKTVSVSAAAPAQSQTQQKTPTSAPVINNTYNYVTNNNAYKNTYNTYALTQAAGGGAGEDSKLQALGNSLRSEFYAALNNQAGPLPSSGGVVNNIALSQRIDNLSGVTISGATISDSTISGYLSSSGGSLSGDLTVSGSLGLGKALALSSGGTGTSTAPAYGQLLVGNNSGGYDLLSTSSLGIVGGGGAYPFPLAGNATSSAVMLLASSTIGNGTQAGGLTVSGGATTTGSTYLAAAGGNVGVGTTSPFARLSVFAGGDYAAHAASALFAVGSSTAGTATSTFLVVNSNGNVGIGTTTSSSLFAVSGSLTAKNIEGARYADMFGNTSTNGIAGAISDCTGTGSGCVVVVPGGYPATEAVPGVNGAAATTANNISILDQRTGIDWTAINPQGQNPGSNYRAWQDWTTNYYTAPTAIGTNMVTLKVNENAIDGGTNLDSGGYVNKTNWLPVNIDLNSYTPGQHVPVSLTANSYSIGDTLGLAITNYCFGGYSAGGDEGCEGMNKQIYQGNVAYGGALSGSPATGASSVTVSPTQGSGTQGAGRYLIDLASAGTISAGTISAVSSPASSPVTVTGSGTSWPVSTVSATLGSAITPGVNTVTPASYTLGSISSITTATLVCVADHGNFEMLYPTSVNTGAGTFTATFRKPHSSDALVTAGGLCGYVFDLTADDVTNSISGNRVQSIYGTLRFAWPVISSPSSNSAVVWISTGDLYSGYNGQWANTAGKNGYVLYPSAEVTSVQTSGGVSNTLTLASNNVAWANGDSVEELLYPAIHMLEGNDILEKYYNNPGNAAGVGANVTLNGLWSGTDRILSYVNNTASTSYTGQGGTLTAPNLMVAQGEWNYGFSFQQPTDSGLFSVSCPTGGCTKTAYLFQMNNALGYDVMNYDEANQQFTLSAGNRAENYVFGTSTLSVPVSESVTGVLTVSTTTATSTFAGGLSALNFSQTGTATSTFATGINIATGCFSVNGACIAGGSGTNYWTLNGSNNIYNNNAGAKVGINNSTPAYTLDVGGFINTDQYSGYKQNGNTVLYASTTNYSLAVGASNAAGWMAATSTNFLDVAIGPFALQTTPTSAAGSLNVAIGYQSLQNNTLGTQNMGIGYGTLTHNLGGGQNAAIGYQALTTNTTGSNNMAIGASAMYSNVSGASNIAIGSRALVDNTTGNNNMAIGSNALERNGSATSSIAIGYQASYGGATYYNQGGVTIGYKSGTNVLTGSDYNTLLGYQSGYDITAGSNNLILGTEQTTGTGVTTGSNNILLGNGVSAGLNQTGSNQLNIGNLIFGTNIGTGSTLGTGNVGVGTTSPYAKLSIHANNGDTNTTLFAIGSSTASATTTLFSVDNTGLASIFGGLTSYASSTIGDGTQAGGLTISGGATTTGGLQVGGNIVPLSSVAYSLGSASKFFAGSYIAGINLGSNGLSGVATINGGSSAAVGLSAWTNQNVTLTAAGTGNIVITTGGTGHTYFSGANVGVGTSSPFAKFSIGANNGDTNTTLFAVGSSTASATTTLFSVSNTGTASTTGLIVSSAGGVAGCATFDTIGTLSNAHTACGSGGGGTFSWTPTTFGSTAANATSTLIGFNAGLYSLASSTIGDGTQTGGLIISGGATTTGTAYFAGNVGVGTTTPYGQLSIKGAGSSIGLVVQGSNGAANLQQWYGAAGVLKAAIGDNGDFGISDGSRIFLDGLSGETYLQESAGINLVSGAGRNIIFNSSGYDAFRAGGSEAMRIVSTGQVGIGTTTPGATLTVAGAGCFAKTSAGIGCSTATVAGDIYYGAAHAAGGFDVAEQYLLANTAAALPGTIVGLDYVGTSTLNVATSSANMLGVVSTNPGLTFGNYGDSTASTTPLALSGRVPVRVSLEGGPIATGDRITLSSIPGIGMKAGPLDPSVGIALEPYTTGSASSTLMVFVTLQKGIDIAAIDDALLGSDAASSTPDLITSFMSSLFARLTSWLADASNGIHDLYATIVHAAEVHTKELCVAKSDGTEVCVTGDQLAALLAGQAAGSATATASTDTATSTAPAISVNGNNPATINTGDAYADLGATITGPAADLNLGITASVDGATSTPAGSITVDTSTPGTHTIVYSVTDQNGLTGTATRTVDVVDPNMASSTPVVTDTASSTPPVVDATAPGTASSTPQ